MTSFASRPPSRSRRGLFELAALSAGAVISGLVLSTLIDGTERDFAELALGEETRSHYATVDGWPIHCGEIVEAQPCLDGHAARGARPVLLWLGNSQLHAINQKRPGDRTASEILHHALDPFGLDVIAFSIPNANYQELLVLFGYLTERLPLRTLIVPLVFDDFRESGLRAGVEEGLDDPAVAALLEGSGAGEALLAAHAEQAQGNLAALEGTVQERSESFLNGWLDEHWTLWSLRKKARGTLFTRLHALRNTVFGITPQSKRPVIPGTLRINIEALRALLQAARSEDVSVVSYVAPLRSDVPNPYVASEYEAFKEQARGVVREGGGLFTNLEDLVPGEYWGLKNATTIGDDAELDFMHFQTPGHELLADAVRDLVADAGSLE